MGNHRVHISATEGRTLCGLLAERPSNPHQPWEDWITLYRADRSTTCNTCRHVALRYANYSRPIRSADADHQRGLEDFNPDGHGKS